MYFIFNAFFLASFVKLCMHKYVIGYLFTLWEMQKLSAYCDYKDKCFYVHMSHTKLLNSYLCMWSQEAYAFVKCKVSCAIVMLQ